LNGYVVVFEVKQNNVLPERAATLFQKGYNCAQSVLLTMFEHWNGKNEVIQKLLQLLVEE
jgi:hypothetical protein